MAGVAAAHSGATYITTGKDWNVDATAGSGGIGMNNDTTTMITTTKQRKPATTTIT